MSAKPRNRDFKRYYRRVWLNRQHHHSTASFLGSIQQSMFHRDEHSAGALETACMISDCYRKVEIDFDVAVVVKNGKISKRDLKELDNVAYKAAVLKGEIAQYCDVILAACDDLRTWADIEAERQESVIG